MSPAALQTRRLDLGDNRQGNLFGRLGAEIQTHRSKKRAYGLLLKVVQQALGSLTRTQNSYIVQSEGRDVTQHKLIL